MIIAIDESGTFNFEKDRDLRHVFLSAFIQSENGSLKIKQQQFIDWEKSLPDGVKDKKGEVKGNFLLRKHLEDFLKKVVFTTPEIKFSYVSVIPKSITKSLLSKHHKFEVRLMKHMAEKAVSMNFTKKKRNFYVEYEKWLNNRNESEYLKMFCLKHCMADSLGYIAPYAVLNKNEEETHNILFKADKAFIENQNIYWKKYVIHSIRESSKIKPFPVVDTWGDEHPFVKKYIIEDNNIRGIDIETMFTENFNFLDSSENFEIRIADIMAIITNRNWNSKFDYKKIYSAMSTQRVVRDFHIQLQLNDFDEEAMFLKFTSE